MKLFYYFWKRRKTKGIVTLFSNCFSIFHETQSIPLPIVHDEWFGAVLFIVLDIWRAPKKHTAGHVVLCLSFSFFKSKT